jgi:uncharacterized protein with GYD domain
MPTYIILGNFTQEGVTKIKDSPQRLEQARQLSKSLGGELKEFYYTMGQYDFVAIMDVPSNEVALQGMMTIGAIGAVRTESLVAIPADKAAEIIKKLP